ncbi:TlpA family protein disulfide reductase [Sphingobacterium corticibacterium]|uniref:TlpA family protein disulfide reductase n=1 Tax=Sphingobacterium corticibacterium TaxID=2484746 RepID=A0A4Q6XN47_9SPHI|nr:TlpA disulfide reductase family protein [Sphingobacterium corticibacterium]RZF57887.1 TlpA family protein disulfide reductase [Sphingobacterium corticibacterium]
MNNNNNHKSIDATLWEKQTSMYKETFLILLIKFLRLFYRAVENIRILHLGFLCFSLKSLFFKATKNKVVLLYGLLCFMLFDLVVAQAQSPENRGAAEGQNEIKALEIGDTIPEQLWNLPLQVVNHPNGKDTITLNDYRDKKLIILDFWATWCVPCIQSLQCLDSLADKYAEDVLILPISDEVSDKVLEAMRSRSWQLQSVVENTAFKAYFPFNVVPHQIWIRDNRFFAASAASKNVEESIVHGLRGDAEKFKRKDDILDYSPYADLAIYADRKKADVLHSSILTAAIDGLPGSTSRRKTENSVILNYINTSIVSLYQEMLGVPFNRIDVMAHSVAKYVYDVERQSLEGLFCLQLKVPLKADMVNVKRRTLTELNTSFGLKLDSQWVERECYIIFDLPKPNRDTVKSNNVAPNNTAVRSVAFPSFVSRLNYNHVWHPDLPIYRAETTFEGRLASGQFEQLQKDVDQLEKLLGKYGLGLKKEYRRVLIYTLSEVDGRVPPK